MSLHAYPQTSDVCLMFNVVQQYGFQRNTSKSPTDFLPFSPASVAVPTRSARIDSWNQLERVSVQQAACSVVCIGFCQAMGGHVGWQHMTCLEPLQFCHDPPTTFIQTTPAKMATFFTPRSGVGWHGRKHAWPQHRTQNHRRNVCGLVYLGDGEFDCLKRGLSGVW